MMQKGCMKESYWNNNSTEAVKQISISETTMYGESKRTENSIFKDN